MDTFQAMQAEIEALKAKLALANKPRKLTLKVTDKGGVSLYGVGRFPVTLYQSQWARIIENVDDIASFIEANKHLLATKD
jgi:hypothetical protein